MKRQVISIAAMFVFAVSAAAQTQVEATVERTFHFKNINGQHEMDEVATMVRVVAGTAISAFDVPTAMITARGTAEQIGMANWLVDQLDLAATEPGVHEYKASSDATFLRMYYLANVSSPRALQELITVLRQAAETNRIFFLTDKRAIALRGTAVQVALADWFVQGLDRSSPGESTLKYAIAGNKDDQARIFYLPESFTPQNYQTLMSSVRKTAGISKGFDCATLHALAIRGTADNIAMAEKSVAEQVQAITSK